MKRVLLFLALLGVLAVLNAVFEKSMPPYILQVVCLAGINIVLAVSLNLINGFTGQFSIGHAGFMAIGAYASAYVTVTFGDRIRAAISFLPEIGRDGALLVVSLAVGALLAAIAGFIVGVPSLRLRGDYLAIVTLGFGEIIRIFLNNLSQPINITNGPQGITLIDPFRFGSFSFAKTETVAGLTFSGPIKYYYLLVIVLLGVIVINLRLQNSRIGRAWEAIREDEIAARSMGINTRNMKLLAFAMGASFGGVAGGMFSAIQGFISPESFVLVESVNILAMVVLGGMGNIWGVILGALLLSFVPEVLRYTVGPAQQAVFGRTLIDPEVIRMLLFGITLVAMMLFRPAGILPSALRKRELETARA